MAFQFYTDAGLTTPFTGTFVATQKSDGSSPMTKMQLWLGNTVASRSLQRESNPGVDQVRITVVDANPASGHPASDGYLALTSVGLDSAVGGAALNLGTAIASGVGNAVTFWVGLKDSTHVVGTSTEISFTTDNLIDVGV